MIFQYLKCRYIRIFLVLSYLIVGTISAFQYQLYDLGQLISEPKCYATSINDSGQISGIITSNKKWFVLDNSGIQKLQVYQRSSTLGIGCAPYINNFGIVSEIFFNNNGQCVIVEDTKLFLCGDKGKELLDCDSIWIKPENGYCIRISDNLEIVGNIKGSNGKNQVKYINPKLGIKKILPIKHSCTVTGINQRGDVVGWFHTPDGIHSFLWQPNVDTWQIIEKFRAASINDHKIIVGSYQKQQGVQVKGALWDKGQIYVLDDLLDIANDSTTNIDTIEVLNSINNNNEMVGWGRLGGCYNDPCPVLIKRLPNTSTKRLKQCPITLVINPAYEQSEYQRLTLECSRLFEQAMAMAGDSSGSSASCGAVVQYLKNIGTPVAMRVLKDQVAMGRVPAIYLS